MSKYFKYVSIVILFTLVLASCDTKDLKGGQKEVELPVNHEILSNETSLVDDDCVFDLTTQNADFLKGINEFKQFTWIDSIKTAIGKIDEDSVSIHRGGCTHFDFSVSIITQDSTAVLNHSYWFKQISSVTSLLGGQFENSLIDSLYRNKKYSIEESSSQLYFFFDQEQYCSMEFVIDRDNGKTVLSMGYYLC